MSLDVAPDTQATLREYLLSVPEVADLVGTRVHGRVPAVKVFPFVRLHIAPGGTVRVRHRVWRTLFDVHYYGDPTADAAEVATGDGARVVHAAVMSCGGHASDTFDAVLLDADDLLSPFDLPDTSGERDEPLPRHLATVAVYARPRP